MFLLTIAISIAGGRRGDEAPVPCPADLLLPPPSEGSGSKNVSNGWGGGREERAAVKAAGISLASLRFGIRRGFTGGRTELGFSRRKCPGGTSFPVHSAPGSSRLPGSARRGTRGEYPAGNPSPVLGCTEEREEGEGGGGGFAAAAPRSRSFIEELGREWRLRADIFTSRGFHFVQVLPR